MGGFNSGRRGGFGTTEDMFKLDMLDCMRLRQFRPGFVTDGTLTWTNSRTQTVAGRIGYTADMRDPEAAYATLAYTTSSCGVAMPQQYRVALTTTQPHFGGLRWWFICPVSGRRVRCLYLAPHCSMFASRVALGLGYKVQRETWAHQRIRAARAADAKLMGDGCLFGEPPEKPKRMWWATYHRLCDLRERETVRSFLGDRLLFDSDWARAEIAADPSLVAGRR